MLALRDEIRTEIQRGNFQSFCYDEEKTKQKRKVNLPNSEHLFLEFECPVSGTKMDDFIHTKLNT